MEEYIWLFERRESRQFTGSILGSLLFHTLVFAILASTPIFHPIAGDSDKIDVLWYYPSMSIRPQARQYEKNFTATAPAKGVEPPLRQEPAKAAPSAEKAAPLHAAPVKTAFIEHAAKRLPPPPPPQESEAPPLRPLVVAPPEEEKEPETEPEMTIPAAVEPPPKVKEAAPAMEKPPAMKRAAPPVEKPPVMKAAAPDTEKTAVPKPEQTAGLVKQPAPQPNKNVPAKEGKLAAQAAVKETAKTAVDKGAAVQAESGKRQSAESAVQRPEPAGVIKEPQAVAARELTGPSRPAAQVMPGKKEGTEKEGAERKSALVALQAAPRPEDSAGGVKGPAVKKEPAVRKEPASVPAAKPVTAATTSRGQKSGAAETKGLFFPPVNGDLKLEFTGKDEVLQTIRVVALFREFPKARRNTPLTRAESRQVKSLKPRMVRTGESARQAVIEIAGEGIYEFRVETASGQPVEAVFALKIYDRSSKALTKPLGKTRIASSESIVKVLMPEGILWSEDAAFSGSIEDSDSVTKFNSDNGLEWKEYK